MDHFDHTVVIQPRLGTLQREKVEPLGTCLEVWKRKRRRCVREERGKEVRSKNPSPTCIFFSMSAEIRCCSGWDVTKKFPSFKASSSLRLQSWLKTGTELWARKRTAKNGKELTQWTTGMRHDITSSSLFSAFISKFSSLFIPSLVLHSLLVILSSWWL